MGDYRIPVERAADMPFMRETARALADALPNGEVRFLDGQGHDFDPTVLAPVLKEFFGA
jgi:hypothetical protein